MLPKVANQIIHHTSRAVLAVQNQTGQTIRNVLQLQSSSGPSTAAGNLGPWNSSGSSSSGWGSGGPGAGGAKYSSRFHSSYTNSGVGRAATLVDPSISHGVNGDAFDDPDEPPLAPPLRVSQRRRSRSSSVSFNAQERDDHLARIGVLKTVQLHIRARHAFAPLSGQAAVADSPSGTLAADTTDIDEPPSPYLDEAAQAMEQAFFDAINHAKAMGSLPLLLAETKKMKEAVPPPPTAVYNAAIAGLRDIRKEGESLEHILQTYHDMVSRSVVPNIKTYVHLVIALTNRDLEVSDAISALETEMRKRADEGQEAASLDRDRLSQLKSENNFGSALALFHAASTIPRAKLPLAVYTQLLRSCRLHANVDAAIHVYAHLEKRTDLKPPPAVFKELTRVYADAGDIQGVKEVFDEFRSVCESDRLDLDGIRIGGVEGWRLATIGVWNNMIAAYLQASQPAAALSLLEQMMDSTAGPKFSPSDVPLPNSSTFFRVVVTFLDIGDVSSALTWLNRLAAQEQAPENDFLPSSNPSRPSGRLWAVVLDKLVKADRIDELAGVLKTALKVQDDVPFGFFLSSFHLLLRRSLARNLKGDAIVESLDLYPALIWRPIADKISLKIIDEIQLHKLSLDIVRLYIQCDQPVKATAATEEFTLLVTKALDEAEKRGELTELQARSRRDSLVKFGRDVCASILTSGSLNWSFMDALRFLIFCRPYPIAPPPEFLWELNDAYKHAAPEEKSAMTPKDWEGLLYAGIYYCRVTRLRTSPIPELTVPLSSIIADCIAKVNLDDLSLHVFGRMDEVMDRNEFVQAIDAAPAEWKSNILRKAYSDVGRGDGPGEIASVSQTVRVDLIHAKYVEEPIVVAKPQEFHQACQIAYRRFESGVQRGVYPTPEVIAKLIGLQGRNGARENVQKLYDVAQVVMASVHKKWQKNAWFTVEDSMIIALAHAGDTDGAHVHRARVLEQGGHPSADAYGALIQCVKDTTDDTTNAMALFTEAVTHGVVPNIFLYNTAISKLAKARKADHALALFREMQTRNVRPTSVTYGAVIAACCRVGDTQSAEALFEEMSSQNNFRPRVPPFNTMMQLYVHTKPDRERVLHYYNELLRAKVSPTAHTYKLLMDAYGTIEPVDLDAMQKVFDDLVADPLVQVQGTHWAAIINAWGCVRKDVDKAIAIFDSIQSHPSTAKTGSKLPDAVIFESMMNVLVTTRRSDLIPVYAEKLLASKVHMTAYIANLMVKGYAAMGDIEKAREIFESLADPPRGVAAPNNHAPHDSEAVSNDAIPATAPVYREPSTWEAMVRAELGNGNRDQAVALLSRVQARRFPAPVYNRISGIMLDDSVSPWAQTPESASSLSLSS